jgi:hypothetical protein
LDERARRGMAGDWAGKGRAVVDWVEFAARMTLAAVVVLPAGTALLWAVRHWSRSASPALRPAMDPEAAVLAGQASDPRRRRTGRPSR